MGKECEYSKKATLFDRIAIGALSAGLATITYGFLWSIFALFSSSELLPIELFFFFVGVMYLLGFFTLDKYFIEILIPMWKFIIRVFG